MKEQQRLPIEPSWYEVLKTEWLEPYFTELTASLTKERAGNTPIYPPKGLVFNSFKETPFDKVKVVIIGQDPYHAPGQAHGLCFSVPKGVPQPPSLQNIFKELVEDVRIPYPSHGCLSHWASQGVLLLNALLTVREGSPLSHKGMGWEQFTDAVVGKLYAREEPLVFLLWGKSAQEKAQKVFSLIPNKQHLILKAAHPSPLSAYNGFFGCHHFSKANQFLSERGLSPIDWRIL